MKNEHIATTDWLTKGISNEQLEIEKALAVISAKIYIKRTELGLDQKAFAKHMGVTQGLVSRWENGTYNFTVSTLISICNKLDLTFEPQIFEKEVVPQNFCFVKPEKEEPNLPDWIVWKPGVNEVTRKGVA